MIFATVTGNIGKDAELRQAGNDKVCSFSIASSRKSKAGETTQWIRCSIWGARGEKLVSMLTKGKKATVVGELSTREHEGKTYLEVRVSEIDFSGGAKSEGGARKPDPEPAAKSGGSYSDADYGADENDDIPFALACFGPVELWNK